jgi:hypothetical protein
MKILIQHNSTHKYLRGTDAWAKNPAGAHTFPSSFDAVLYCIKRKLEGVNIIIERSSGRGPLVVSMDKTALEEAGAALKVKPLKGNRTVPAHIVPHRVHHATRAAHV